MTKNKKKNKKNPSLYKAIKPYIPNNRVLYSALGVIGAGLAISSIIGKDRRQALAGKVTKTVKGLGLKGTTTAPDVNTDTNLAMGK